MNLFFLSKYVALVSFVLVGAGCSPSFSQTKVYSTEQIRSDFKLFRMAFEEAHPSLYRFRTKADLDSFFDKAYSSLDHPMSELDLYKKVATIISRIGCGHTGVRLSEDYYNHHPVRTVRFPFDVEFVAEKLFVVKDYTEGKEIAAGDEIISLDNVPISNLVSEFFSMMNGDGYVTTFKYKRLQQNFSALVQIMHEDNSVYKVVYKTGDGKIQTKSISMVPTVSIPAMPWKPDLEFKIDTTSSTAILTIRSFEDDTKDAKGVSFTDFMQQSFVKLRDKKIQSLIIDLRGNGGGNDQYGALLFAYLTDKPFRYYNYLQMNKPAYSFLQYTNKQESFKKETADILVQRKDGSWIRKNSAHPCLPEQESQPMHFDNSVYVLVDGNTFSASTEFAAITKDYNRAVFIGEESGGGFEGNTSGGSIELTLPATKLRIVIPLTKYVSAVVVKPGTSGRGIVPDKLWSPSLQSILRGNDEVMERTLALAHSK